MSWIYKQTEPQLWTVGFYTPDGTWEPETDHDVKEDAADRVAYLNGAPDLAELVNEVIERLQLMKEEHEAERRHSAP